ELSAFKKVLLENSAIAGVLDMKFGIITNVARLRAEYKPFSSEWNKKIVDKYFETLYLANGLTQTLHSNKFSATKFFAFYQPYQVPDKFVQGHQAIKDSISKTGFGYDVSDLFLPLGKEIYFDIVHVQ